MSGTKIIDPKEIPTKDLHQYIVGAIAPRPIAFASTMDENGVANIAPYSFFNAFSSNPSVLVFSSNRRVADNTTKDTLHNIEKNKEVVINVVNYNIVRQMALASISYPSNISEFEKAGLTPTPADLVKPYRIKESPVQFECKVSEIITLGDHGGAGHLIICNVLRIHVQEDVMTGNRIDPHKLDLVGRLGRAYYVRASGDAIFSIYQSPVKLALGMDQLPASIRKSNVLTGNEIATIAGQMAFPGKEEVNALLNEHQELAEILAADGLPTSEFVEKLHQYAKKELAQERIPLAFAALMLADEQQKKNQ